MINRYQSQGGSTATPEFRTFRAGVIQNFEFTYELSWKAMRTWLAENQGKTVVDGVTRKELFRLAAESRLIQEVEPWFEYHKQRNQTSYTYEESTANEAFEITEQFLNHATKLYQTLQSKND